MNLQTARLLTHAICQLPSKAARANLVARDDDSHSNLGWHEEYDALLSHPMDDVQLGFSFERLSLLFFRQGALADELRLDRLTESEVTSWCDDHLLASGLVVTGDAVMPYELEQTAPFNQLAEHEDAVRMLGGWYGAADSALKEVTNSIAGQFVPGASSVRCWPHHFDIATLVSLETGDPETARSVGLGFSPGDGSYADPYFYCSPWPAPEVDQLPSPPAGFAWHTQGFVSIVMRDPVKENLANRLTEAFKVAVDVLGWGQAPRFR